MIEVARKEVFWSLPQKEVECLEATSRFGRSFQIEVTEERGDLEEALDSVHRRDERAGAFREQMSLPHSLVLCNAKIFTLR